MATTKKFLKGSITNMPRKEKNVIKTTERQNKSGRQKQGQRTRATNRKQ